MCYVIEIGQKTEWVHTNYTHSLVTVHTSRYLMGEFFDFVITFVAYLKVVDKLFTMVHIT
jgi:hypothetical protein